MINIKPTILIGLGVYGGEIVEFFINKINKQSPNNLILGSIIKDCYLTEDKQIQSPNETISLNGLNSDYHNFGEGFFSTNILVFYEQVNNFKLAIRNILNDIQSISTERLLLDNNYSRQDNQIIIITSIFDAVGSSLLIPVLDALSDINEKFSINIILLLPGLSRSKDIPIKHIESSRAYACLAELDSELPNWDNIHGIFLIENKNEKSATIGLFDNILSFIPDFIEMLIYDKIFTSTEITDIIGLPVSGSNKFAFYSSFGIAKICYHPDFLLKILECKLFDHLLSEISTPLFNSKEGSISKDLVGAEVRRFILNNDLLNISKQLKKDNQGENIFKEFKIQNIQYDSYTDINIFIDAFAQQVGSYEQNKFVDVIRSIDNNSEELLTKIKASTIHFIDETINKNRNEGYEHLISFLGYLLEKKTEYLHSEEISIDVYNIKTVLSKAYEFYENKLGLIIDRKKLEELNITISNKEEYIKILSTDSTSSKEEIKAQEEELAGLIRESDQLIERINSLTLKIKDPNFRRNLLVEETESFNDKISEGIESLKEKELPLRKKRNLYEELKLKISKSSKRLFITYPILIGIVLLVFLLLYYRYIDSTINLPELLFFSQDLLFIISFILLVLVIYFIWSYSYFKLRLGTPLKKSRNEIEILERNKIDGFNRLIVLSKAKFYNEFEHRIHTVTLSVIQKLLQFLNQVFENVLLFPQEINKLQEIKSAEYQKLINIKDLFNENTIIDKNIIEYLFNQKTDNINLFFTKGYSSHDKDTDLIIGGNKISHYLIDFAQNGSGAIDIFKNEVNHFNTELFKVISDKGIYDILFDKGLENFINKENTFRLLLDSSNAWINLNIDNVNDASFPISNLYLDTNNELLVKKVKEILNDLSDDDHSFNPGNKNAIIRLKVKAGFPAFSVSSLKEFYSILANYGEVNSKITIDDFFIKPKYSTISLFNEYDMGVLKISATLETAVLACALKLIKDQNGKFIIGSSKFNNFYELEAFLNSEDGDSIFETLQKDIEDIKNRASEDEDIASKTKDMLERFSHNSLESPHLTIIRDLINYIGRF